MNYYKNVFLYAFTIFSILFGWGNVIFPMYLKNFKFSHKRGIKIFKKHKTERIVSYVPKLHQESIYFIAMEEMHRLASMFYYTKEEYQYVWENDVLAALDDKEVISKVYLFEEKPVAFITYGTYMPWYNFFYSSLHAKIYHLAVKKKSSK